MGLLESLGARSVEQLRTLGGSLDFLEELHEKLPRRRVSSDKEYLNEWVHRAAHLVGQANLNAIFAEFSDESTRTLLAQVAMTFFVWDPLALLVPDDDFEKRAAAAVTAMRMAERVAEPMHKHPAVLLSEVQPPEVCEEILLYTILHMMRRPLAFLMPKAEVRGPLATGVLRSLPFDAGIQQRHVTDRHPKTGQNTPHMLILQCSPLAAPIDDVKTALAAAGIDFLQFSPEEVFASFAGGERVLDMVRTRWNWQAIEERGAHDIQ